MYEIDGREIDTDRPPPTHTQVSILVRVDGEKRLK